MSATVCLWELLWYHFITVPDPTFDKLRFRFRFHTAKSYGSYGSDSGSKTLRTVILSIPNWDSQQDELLNNLSLSGMWYVVPREASMNIRGKKEDQQKTHHQCCGSGMFIPYPGSWFLPIPDPESRIPDLGSPIQKQQQKRWVKNFFFIPFSVATNFT